MDNDEAVKEYNLTRLWDRTHNGLIILLIILKRKIDFFMKSINWMRIKKITIFYNIFCERPLTAQVESKNV